MTDLSQDLALVYRSVSDLKPYGQNPRTHSAKQIRQIAESIRQFGFTNPILIDTGGGVIAGHGRLAAAKHMGLERVPTIRLDQMTEAQKRAYVIADNKLAENSGWDRQLLALELQYVSDLDVDFDLTITGFENAEIDILLNSLDEVSVDPLDSVPEIKRENPPVSAVGDLWVLGRHRLICADARLPSSFSALLGRQQAQLVFIDPPYNVPVDGHVCGLGRFSHRDFPMASGEMSEAEFSQFLENVLAHLTQFSQDGSIHFVCMDWRHLPELLTAGHAVYSELKNLCVWAKTNGGMGSLYRSQHELILVFKNGTAPHVNNVELGRHGRYRTNVWHYPGVNSLGAGRDEALSMHPTVKPVALVADALLDCSKRNGLVLDCFGGSGTSLIAAERTGRRGYLIELDPVYVDVTITRFQGLTGEDAVHEGTGLTFSQLRDQRNDTLPPHIGMSTEVAHGS